MNDQEKAAIHEEVKADFLLKEQEEKAKNKWLNYLSISTILIAICTTLSTYIGSNYGSQSMQSQLKASDQWAFYQGKSIKEYLYEIQINNLETQLLNPQMSEAAGQIRTNMEGFKKNVDRYKTEKEQISKDARKEEHIRDDASNHSNAFGLAVVFLEVSILLSSIAALIKKKPIWYLSMAVGLAGIVYFADGFLLLF
jgi:hypothetical protein